MSSDARVTPPDEQTSSSEETTARPDAPLEHEGPQVAPHDSVATPEEPPVAETAPPTTPTTDEPAATENAAPEPSPPSVPPTGSAEPSPAEEAKAEEAAPPEAVPSESQPSKPAPKIQVGSRRGKPGETPQGSLPNAAVRTKPPEPEATEAADAMKAAAAASEEPTEVAPAGRPPRVATTVRRPSVRDPLPADLEAELNSAMENVSLDAIAEGSTAPEVTQLLEPEARYNGTIVRIHGDNVFVTLGGRNEGVVSLRSFREPPNVGDTMEVVIKGFNAEDGIYEVFVPGASIEVSGWSDLTDGAVVEARITGANTGGLECMVNNIRGFIPASQIGLFRVEDFAEYIGKKLYCVVSEVNRKRKNLVLSHRALLEREKEEARKNLLEEIEPGQKREGVVRSIQSFGAFVDLGGVDGLIHISQLSWERVNHPSEVLAEGQKVEVKVEKINRQTGKIALSYRELQEHPWAKVQEQFSEGSMAKGPVTRVAKFGAFVKLAPGVEGLIHISEMAHYRVRSVSDVVSEGQEVEVKVLSVDTDAQRIALSIKAALPEPEPEDQPSETASASSDAKPQKPKRKRPLKGGFDRPSGGEHFGLKW
jgi:small subunit ribosomal protein S1